MMEDIYLLFSEILENINVIKNNDFYSDKGELDKIEELMKNWFDNYKELKTLKVIDPKNLEFLDLEITDLFDKYIVTESATDNFVERLLYNFGILERAWKTEMMEVKNGKK